MFNSETLENINAAGLQFPCLYVKYRFLLMLG